MTATLVFILSGMLAAATPMLFAALGESVAERSGVLNLSVEGMMATGAAFAFAVATLSGSHTLGFLAGGTAAALLSLVFAALVLVFHANQVAAGLAIGVLGLGVSAFAGNRFEGAAIAKPPSLDIPGLSDLPVVGPILFSHDAMVYLGILLVPVVALVFTRTKLGLSIRAVGENPEAARAIGTPVLGIRLGCVLFGGFMAGLGGAHLSIAYTALWAEGLVAGRGWIAVALVVFGSWLPFRIALGAYVFGAISLMELSVQGLGLAIPSQLLSASPYIVTILVLAAISRDQTRLRLTRPLSLGKPFRGQA
ncbi:ABC transporter permease [Chthonobacter albigriseus]|uniref:ABC transporter permease n=1 Tax=Chthonobacter albigriseus TaxID=1683161 RepID=UPI0015EF0E4A|nr:ABC transporter permease [Chthonobacter albigriseus]